MITKRISLRARVLRSKTPHGAVVLAVVMASSCSRPPRPPVMAEADRVRSGMLGQASELAPEAMAHADKLRRDADAAYARGDLAGAQILAERTIVAYQHALVLARVVRATDAANRARLALQAAEQTLAQNEGEQRRVSAQADDIELRIKVIKDAVPLAPTGPGDPAREQARMASSRSLAVDARLLCGAARMLAPETPALTEARATSEDVDKRLAANPRVAPIETAMRARSQCLAALTAARRLAGATSSIGKSDQLLAELSSMGALAPVRDDRGVIVTVRNVFAAAELTADGREQLGALGRVAQAHPDFPVQVVVHSSTTKGKGREDDRKRGDTIAKALADAGASSERISIEAAGTAHRLLDGPPRSERVEIIFVDPGG
jgi:outer membrane protein OmpA-like peptidoglycan-associated protein